MNDLVILYSCPKAVGFIDVGNSPEWSQELLQCVRILKRADQAEQLRDIERMPWPASRGLRSMSLCLFVPFAELPR
ncbi:hypothetical protein [Mesorhizobium sp. M0408]|uniref:hypothetical protein n=1 Tax=Mesorhizobium sp. M0408 TaxID=2956942 RepID=UPI0033384670